MIKLRASHGLHSAVLNAISVTLLHNHRNVGVALHRPVALWNIVTSRPFAVRSTISATLLWDQRRRVELRSKKKQRWVWDACGAGRASLWATRRRECISSLLPLLFCSDCSFCLFSNLRLKTSSTCCGNPRLYEAKQSFDPYKQPRHGRHKSHSCYRRYW